MGSGTCLISYLECDGQMGVCEDIDVLLRERWDSAYQRLNAAGCIMQLAQGMATTGAPALRK
jgi:hypothetical protein